MNIDQRLRRLEEKVSSTKTKKRRVTEEKVSSGLFLTIKKFLPQFEDLIDTVDTEQANQLVPDEWDDDATDNSQYIISHLEKISNLSGELQEMLERFEKFKG